jgi:hypothetical protein
MDEEWGTAIGGRLRGYYPSDAANTRPPNDDEVPR